MTLRRGARLRPCRRSFVAVACLVLACGASDPQRRDVDVSLEFVAMWWSESQIEGLDPDDPPPKRTEVRIERWEYTDPIAVPNPEVFDVVARLSGSSERGELRIRAEQRWAIGPLDPLHEGASTSWSEWEPLASKRLVHLQEGREEALRIASVELATRQDQLFASDRWPWAFEVRVEVSDGAGTLTTAVRRLEIRPGD